MKPETENGTELAADSPLPRVPVSQRLPIPASPRPAASRRRFSAHVAWTLAARVLMTINSVVAGVIVARWLGADGLGQLAVINVAVATIVQLASVGLPSANTYFIAQDKRHLGPAAINSLIFAVIAGGLLGLALVGLAAWWSGIFGFLSPRLIGIAAVSIPFQLITLIGLNIFLAVGSVGRFNLLDLVGQSFVLINAVVALLVLNAGLWMLVSLNTGASLLVGLIIVILIGAYGARLKEGKRWRPDVQLFRRMMRYGVKFHIATLAGLLIFRIDLLVVNHFRGAADAGVYSVATQFGMMLMLLPSVIATLLFPRVTAEQGSRTNMTCRATRHTTLIMLLICLASVPGSFVLPLLYGVAFYDVTVQVLILLPGVLLIGIESVLVQYFTATGFPLAIPMFWLLTLVVNVGLTFALVSRFGARGAALASTISYALIFALVAYYFRAKTRSALSDVLIIRANEFRGLLRRA